MSYSSEDEAAIKKLIELASKLPSKNKRQKNRDMPLLRSQRSWSRLRRNKTTMIRLILADASNWKLR